MATIYAPTRTQTLAVPLPHTVSDEASYIRHGTGAARQVSLALFLAGFCTFALLYCVQPMLPVFSAEFGVNAAASALPLSLTLGGLALSIVGTVTFSLKFSRRNLMFASMVGAALLNVAAALAPSWQFLLTTRFLEGVALGGVPAVAMAYLSEEMDRRDLGKAMGLYIAGTAFGGMMGRIAIGPIVEFLSWRGALAGMGAAALIAAIGFFCLIPKSRHAPARHSVKLCQHLRIWGQHLRHTAMLRLFAIGFILNSIFVMLFNYVSFRLSEPPYELGESAISAIFLLYMVGMVASVGAGHASDRFGRRAPLALGLASTLLGALVTLGSSLPLIIAGIALVTIGLFMAHSVASAWIGQLAGPAKGHGAALYLLFYYTGGSVIGSLAGYPWEHGGWSAVVIVAAGFALLGIVLTFEKRPETVDG